MRSTTYLDRGGLADVARYKLAGEFLVRANN